MLNKVTRAEIADTFPQFTRIKHLRSLLRVACDDSKTKAWVDKENDTRVVVYDNLCFIDAPFEYPNITELLSKLPEYAYVIAPQDENNEQWRVHFEKEYTTVQPTNRYAFSSEDLSIKMINEMKRPLPDGFRVKLLGLEDEHYFDEEMSHNLLRIYPSIRQLLENTNPFGIIDKKNDILVSLCTGYPLLELEDEIDILTRDDANYRRRGFATRVALESMQDSLIRGRVPVWDAANERSKDMALKLGFTNPQQYTSYIVKK